MQITLYLWLLDGIDGCARPPPGFTAEFRQPAGFGARCGKQLHPAVREERTRATGWRWGLKRRGRRSVIQLSPAKRRSPSVGIASRPTPIASCASRARPPTTYYRCNSGLLPVRAMFGPSPRWPNWPVLNPGCAGSACNFTFSSLAASDPLISEAAHCECEGSKEAQVRRLDTQ